MNIDNFSIIKPLLAFDSDDDFYHLQIIKRKKEHPELGSNSLVIKTYYIRSLEYLEMKRPEIINLCDFHDARACINLNRRSFEKAAFQMLIKVSGQIMNKDFKSVRKAYDSVCRANSNEPNKKWIIDVDTLGTPSAPFCYSRAIVEAINSVEPKGDKLIAFVPTKNGYHIICSPFNKATAKLNYSIHKDNLTILYAKDDRNVCSIEKSNG